MRNAELGPVVCEYTKEDLVEAAEWPPFSNIRIVKNHVPTPLENAKRQKERAEEIERIEALLVSSDEELDTIRQQLKTAQHNKDQQAFIEILDSYSEFLEYVKRLKVRLYTLNNPMF